MNLTDKEIIELEIILEKEMDRCFEQEQFYKTYTSKYSEKNRDYYRKQYFHLKEILEKLRKEFNSRKENN